MVVNLANILPINIVGVVSGTLASGTPTGIHSLAAIQDVTIVNQDPLSMNLADEELVAPTGTFAASLTVSGEPVTTGTAYVGADGIQYIYDHTRDKYLSTTRQTLQYGKNLDLHGAASVLPPAGTIAAGQRKSANPMYRDATITAMAAQGAAVSGSVYIRARELADGGGGTDLHDMILDGSVYPNPPIGPISTVSGGLNIDIPAGSGIEVLLPGTPETMITDPLVNIEIAWRDG